MLLVLMSLAASAIAAALVYYSWRSPDKAPADGAGWLLALVSVFAWSKALGAEFGVTYAIIVFVCLVWIIIAFTMQANRSAKPFARRPYQALRRPGFRACARHGVLFLLSVPTAGVTAMMLSVAVVLNLPWSMPAKVAVVVFLFPVLWGAMSTWLCAQDKLLKPALASVGMLAACSLFLFA